MTPLLSNEEIVCAHKIGRELPTEWFTQDVHP